MPYAKIPFKPGLVLDDAPLRAEGAIVDMNWMRFVRGMPQTIGGTQAISSTPFTGIARGGAAGTDFAGTQYHAWGTADGLWAMLGGEPVDITPPHSEGVLTNPFTTVNGSTTVSVAHTNHGLTTGNTVTFAHAVAVGGVTVNGTYAIDFVLDRNTYQITTASASSSATGGGLVDYSASFLGGLVDGIAGSGWGIDGYGEGPYGGVASIVDTLPRIWSIKKFGKLLLANPRGGGLYAFQPVTVIPELVTNGDFAVDQNWTKGTGWTISGGQLVAAAGSASAAYQSAAIEGGSTYRVTFTVSGRTAGNVAFKGSNAGTPVSLGDASSLVTVNGTYSRIFRAPNTIDGILFDKDNAFDGDIDTVSVKLENRAFRVTTAPGQIDSFIVDPHNIVILLGTESYIGDVYNPLLVRWSALEDYADYVPAQNNVSGELTLSQGGRVVGGVASRQQNLLWTEDQAFTMVYQGGTEEPFRIELAGSGGGLIAANAAVDYNGVVYWMGRTNFYAFSGGAPQVIPCDIRRDVTDHIAAYQEEKICAGVNSAFGEVVWFYPDSRDGNENSRYAIFHIGEGVFSAGQAEVTTWIPQGVYQYPIGIWTDGLCYFHEIGTTLNGAPINAYVETAFMDNGDGDRLMSVRGIRLECDDQVGPVTAKWISRWTLKGSDVTAGPFTFQPTTDERLFRTRGRYHKLRIEGNAAPLFFRIGAVSADINPTQERR